MNKEELEAQVRFLEDRLRTVEDVEKIKKLQRMYGYYLDYGRWDEVVDLFSDNAESIEVADSGVFLGKAGVKRFVMDVLKANRVPKEAPRGELHAALIGQPVISVDAGGKRAYGRWGSLECAASPVDGTWRQYWAHGIYENEYIKEDGKWRFKKLHFYLTFRTPYEDGWLKTPVIGSCTRAEVKPDRPSTSYHPYPEVCTVPFHYKHPITEK
jgi:hypothetical protein